MQHMHVLFWRVLLVTHYELILCFHIFQLGNHEISGITQSPGFINVAREHTITIL